MNISVVVDTIWKKYWKERFDIPINDAESCFIKNNKILEIGKPITELLRKINFNILV